MERHSNQNIFLSLVEKIMPSILRKNPEALLYIAWAVALSAVLGSLYFSDIRNFPPCVLCWYQRIFMYPIVLILGMGILRRDKGIYNYVLPLSLIGLFIAVYHNLLYYSILPESAAPCIAGISCTTKFIEYLGFVTIPFLSMTGFLAITFCMLLYWRLTTRV